MDVLFLAGDKQIPGLSPISGNPNDLSANFNRPKFGLQHDFLTLTTVLAVVPRPLKERESRCLVIQSATQHHHSSPDSKEHSSRKTMELLKGDLELPRSVLLTPVNSVLPELEIQSSVQPREIYSVENV